MLIDLQTQLDRLPNLQRQQAIAELFGKFQFARMAALMDNFNKTGTQSAKVIEMMGLSAGELSDIAEDVMKQTKESLEQNNIEKHPYSLCDMSGNMLFDERIVPFAEYLIGTSYNILDSQGYDLSFYDVGLSSIWMQEHHKYSDMAEHIHGADDNRHAGDG